MSAQMSPRYWAVQQLRDSGSVLVGFGVLILWNPEHHLFGYLLPQQESTYPCAWREVLREIRDYYPKQ